MNRKTSSPAARTAEHGFTLIEIMVVIVILGLLATLVVPNVIGASDEAKEKTARANIASIASAVKMYRVTNGKLPDTLDVLVEKDERGRSQLEELPKDPWGNEYMLREGDRPGEWEVISMGMDGSEGTEDDISNRTREE
jgi:general secretion pathway protein G